MAPLAAFWQRLTDGFQQPYFYLDGTGCLINFEGASCTRK